MALMKVLAAIAILGGAGIVAAIFWSELKSDPTVSPTIVPIVPTIVPIVPTTVPTVPTIVKNSCK